MRSRPVRIRHPVEKSTAISVVGAAEKAQLEKLGLHVIDASAQGWGIVNHDLFLSNEGIRRAIRDAAGAWREPKGPGDAISFPPFGYAPTLAVTRGGEWIVAWDQQTTGSVKGAAVAWKRRWDT